ncbi:glycoside hydrolase family 172 protein [Draconibacterium sediminis]|uniref:glycoside hydrolase family 172 protein n=1 Tax=Draconibacterium sediminis TaxID=1544798 RepID=UPI0006965B42|nr:glycoside hydrolase family 172 protein [Draconibacterium sediminis]
MSKIFKTVNFLFGVSLTVFFLGCTVIDQANNQVVSVTSLLQEMTSREQLSRYPKPAFITKHVSSYDRSSVSPTEKNWFHNWDMNQWEGVEQTKNGKEYVLMDEKSPGAITHFWMTGAGKDRGQGTLRIYIDGNEKPVISQTIRSFIGENKEVGYPLSCSVSPETIADERGHNLYLPIPYAKSCKITYQSDLIKDGNPWETGSEILYYNIDYRAYAEGVEIESFTDQSIAQNRSLIAATNQMLLEGRFREESESEAIENFQMQIAPGDVKVLSKREAGAAINELNLRIQEDEPTQSLRSLIIKCEFDGKQTVWAPVGDFFGAGYRIDAYETRYNKVSVDGNLTSKWLMPFEKACKISVENIGEETIGINGSIQFAAYKWSNKSMHFYTSWHQYTKYDTGTPKGMLGGNGTKDVNFVSLKGKGIYVGDVLTLFNDNLPPGKATWKKEDGSFSMSWWGEGDEKIYIDGEVFPSHFGTGTEDYYCYAWCKPESFSHPFIAQPSGEGNLTPGYTVNARVRALDVLPFNTSLRFDMELWHWNKARVNYAPTTFYYMMPGGETNIKPDYEGAREQVLLDFEKMYSNFNEKE